MDEKTFEERAMRCAAKLYGVSYLILRCDADCQDAVQEAMMRAWRKKDDLREEAYFETWLVRILINESKRLARKRAALPSASLPESLPAAQPEDAKLRDAIRALDERHRLPIVLYYVQGYKVGEVARILRLPEGTVKGRLAEGRKRLRVLLEEGEV